MASHKDGDRPTPEQPTDEGHGRHAGHDPAEGFMTPHLESRNEGGSNVKISGATGFQVGQGNLQINNYSYGDPIKTLPQVSIAIPRDFPARLPGRGELIEELMGIGTGEIVLLSGMAGVGKSVVAASVAERYEAEEHPVYWVRCSSRQAVAASMLEVAQAAGMPAAEASRLVGDGASQPFEAVWSYLNQHRDAAKWLLVFDDADTPAVLSAPGGTVAEQTGWLRPSRRGLVVVTSRNRDPGVWGPRVRAHQLQPLSPANGAQVLRDLAPNATTVRVDAVALSKRLGNLPLGLRVAGAYLANPASRHRNAASYLRDLPSDPAQALSRACDITLEAIAESGYPQDPASADWMNWAWTPWTPISRTRRQCAAPKPRPASLHRTHNTQI